MMGLPLLTVLHHDGERAPSPGRRLPILPPSRTADENIVVTTARYKDLLEFAESARLVHPWHLRGRTVQLYLRNGPAFLRFLARPLLFLFLLVLPVVS